MRLLLVDDDARLAGAVRTWMAHGGHEVDWIVGGGEADAALRQTAYDCVVLDLGLPDIGGEEVLRRLRDAGNELPVVIVTGREQVADRVRLLDLGADDFVVKPVHLDELLARVRAVMRRRGGHTGELHCGGLRVVPATQSVLRDGTHVALTNREFRVLEILARNKDRVTARDQLEEALRGSSEAGGSNTVEVHIHHLRRKLGAEVIRTVRGIGYALRKER